MLPTTKFWIWLSLVSDVPAAWQVCRHFGSPEKAYFAPLEEFRKVRGLNSQQIAAFANKDAAPVERVLSECERLGVHIFTWQDADYPEHLRNIYTPPLVLYARGLPLDLNEECTIAMAGTRNCSPYGRAMSEQFAHDLTCQGALVVTGVAHGCDEAALWGAIKAGGPVVALLPGGVDVPFESNRYYHSLYEDIRACGMLLSPYPPGTPNDHAHFRFRNPVLTGLCVATLCVEAGKRSGTLNVAYCAQEQQRTVYTIPANLDSPYAAGTNALMCSGLALPVMSAEDILLTYRSSYARLGSGRVQEAPRRLTPSEPSGGEAAPAETSDKSASAPAEEPDSAPSERASASSQPPEVSVLRPSKPQKGLDTGDNSDYIDLQKSRNEFTDDEQALLRALQAGDKTAEDLTAETELPAQRILSALTLLTLRGYVEESAPSCFHVRVRVK